MKPISVSRLSSDANYLILVLAHFDIFRDFQGVQDRLYVGLSVYGELSIKRVPLLWTVQHEML